MLIETNTYFQELVQDFMEDENLPAQCHPAIKPKKKKEENKKDDTV